MSLFQMGHLTLEDYQIWSVKNVLANEFLNLLFQVCLRHMTDLGGCLPSCACISEEMEIGLFLTADAWLL